MPAPEMREIAKVDFAAWLAAYPRKLMRDVCGICEPPIVTWNDFERAPYWPDSIVAQTSADSGRYFVLEDINAPVVTDHKPDLESLSDEQGVEVREGDRIRIHWGWDSVTGDHYREHTVTKRDVGTPYEAWCPHDCANDLRSMPFRKISAGGMSVPSHTSK